MKHISKLKSGKIIATNSRFLFFRTLVNILSIAIVIFIVISTIPFENEPKYQTLIKILGGLSLFFVLIELAFWIAINAPLINLL